MRPGSRLILGMIAASLVLTGISPFITPQSNNPCSGCHGNTYHQYLDIREGDPGNILPPVLNDSELLTIAVVVKNICDAPKYNVMVGIAVSLGSQNGYFSVQTPIFNIASLDPGQTATATWQIFAVAHGNDTMLISATAHNNHYGCQFADSYDPSPTIFVNKTVIDLPPSIAIHTPAAGLVLTGGTDRLVSWGVIDEDKSSCMVDLFYSTDDFAMYNETLATAVPASQTYTWTLPVIDCSTVSLKASVIDPGGHYNETRMGGHFTIDSTPPEVVSVEPRDGETNVTDSAIFVVRFSEPVTLFGSRNLIDISPDPGGQVWTWNTNRTVVTGVHSQFAPGTTYTCTVSPNYKDISIPGNIANGTFTWSFSTPSIIVPVPSIVLSSPDGGERYWWGDRIPVCWSASGGTGSLGINLSVSGNGVSGPFDLVANRLTNTGSYDMKVPHLASDTCIIEATVYDQNGMGSRSLGGVFAIAPDLVLNAFFPPATDPVTANSSVDIAWNATGGHGDVSVVLLFQLDDNSSPQTIVSGMPRSGIRSWTAPEANSVAARFALNATDGWGRSVAIVSPPFTVKTKNPPPPPPPPPPAPKPNNPPVVRFGLVGDRVMEKSLASFDASASFDPDGDKLYYLWDFGDWTNLVNSTGPNATHIFQYSGVFLVQLVVSDGKAETAQTMTVTVTAVPAAAQDSSAGDGPIVWLGIVIMIVGFVGLAYSAAGRMSTPASKAPGLGKGAAPAQDAGTPAGQTTPEAIAAYIAVYGAPPPTAGPAGSIPTSTPSPVEAVPASGVENPSEACPDAVLLEQALCSRSQPAPAAGTPVYAEVAFPLLLDPELCIGCGACSKACRCQAITMMDGRPALDPARCTSCGDCVNGCIRQAVSFNPAFRSGRTN